MAARPTRTVRIKALRLVCWNADGVRGKNIELEHFLSQHCHRTDRPTAGGGTAFLVRCGIVHNSLPVPGLTHLEATAVQVTLARRPVKILAAYLSPSRLLIEADLTASFGGGLPGLMAGDLNAKHVDWNSRLTTRRGKRLRDYADENPCLIFGRDTPTTKSYNPFAIPVALVIALTKQHPFPLYLTSCSPLSSDQLPVYIDTACRSSFHHPPDRPNFRRTDWANFQTHLEDHIPIDPDCSMEWQ